MQISSAKRKKRLVLQYSVPVRQSVYERSTGGETPGGETLKGASEIQYEWIFHSLRLTPFFFLASPFAFSQLPFATKRK